MPRKSPPKPDEKPQFERFIDAAKKVGAAETDEGLPVAIRKVAGAKVAATQAGAVWRAHEKP
jgi:hypothetical protein